MIGAGPPSEEAEENDSKGGQRPLSLSSAAPPAPKAVGRFSPRLYEDSRARSARRGVSYSHDGSRRSRACRVGFFSARGDGGVTVARRRRGEEAVTARERFEMKCGFTKVDGVKRLFGI